MNPKFAIQRADGRSNGQVLLNLIKDGEPGRVYKYEEIAAALQEGTNREFGVPEVRQVVASSYVRLLKELAAALHNVRGVGYRLAFAKDHRELAVLRRRRADLQFKKGLHTLRHVRWDEMDENTRKAHEGHLMITEALYLQQAATEKRLKAVEDAVRNLQNKST